MTFSPLQRAALFFGFLLVAISLTYVPYDAKFVDRKYEERQFIGYHPIWSPPDNVTVCLKTFRMRINRGESVGAIVDKANNTCSSWPKFKHALLTAAGAACLTLAMFFLFASGARRSAA